VQDSSCQGVELNAIGSVLYGGVEAGGTKFVCAVGTGPDDVEQEIQFPTTSPSETVDRVTAFFQQWRGRLAGVGIGSFGPLDLRPESTTCGQITSTPKPGWGGVNLARMLEGFLAIPVTLDTDVNAAALGEYRWGAAQGLDTFIYMTVGTGIGGGGMVNGRLMHGLLHPEMGHIRVPHDLNADPFAGLCPYHGDCLEGLAAGPAIRARWGRSPESMPADHEAWELEAGYLALALANFIFTLSPQRIILGGGVMAQPCLMPLIREKVRGLLNGYVQTPEVEAGIDRYIVPPGLGKRAGMLGAIALAQQ
jgi:fructokinase